MAFFIQLSSYWVLLWIVSKFSFQSKLRSHALKARLAFSVSFIVIGLIHLINPQSLAYMIGDLLPYPSFWVVITGLLEILLAVFLMIKKYQKKAAWAIIVYLILVFPANINVAINGLNPPGGLPATPLYIWSRLLFQPVYIAWVYFSSIKPYKFSGKRKEL